MQYRTGLGYDLHRFAAGRKLFLGAIEIPYVKGLLGHSDADVLLHAICDALLGAACLGDIGEHFPDTDPQYAGASSAELLKKTNLLIKEKLWRICNIDAVIIAEEPKLLAFKKKIAESIAALLGIAQEKVSVKAKSNEGLGALGRKEAIACYAIALIAREE